MASIDKNKTKSNGLLRALRITWRRRWRLTMEINRISLTSSDVRCSILHTDKANIRSRVECQEADAAAAGAIWEFSLSIRLNIFPINLSSGFVCHSVDSTASRHVKTRSLERESSNSSPRPFIHVHVSREFCFSSNIPLSDRLKFSGGEKILKKDFFCIGHLLALRKKRIKKGKRRKKKSGAVGISKQDAQYVVSHTPALIYVGLVKFPTPVIRKPPSSRFWKKNCNNFLGKKRSGPKSSTAHWQLDRLQIPRMKYGQSRSIGFAKFPPARSCRKSGDEQLTDSYTKDYELYMTAHFFSFEKRWHLRTYRTAFKFLMIKWSKCRI